MRASLVSERLAECLAECLADMIRVYDHESWWAMHVDYFDDFDFVATEGGGQHNEDLGGNANTDGNFTCGTAVVCMLY